MADATKRGVDIVLAALLLAVMAPVLAVCALAIVLESRGPVLHRAVRTGRDGRTFTMLKLRSMVVDGDGTGAAITAEGDRRVTRVGRVLRSTKLDELPQLLNVLRGDMSLVGPRPEDPRYVASYTPDQRAVLRVRPGITSPAALAYRDEERILGAADDVEEAYVATVLPDKLRLDLAYVSERTLAGDLRILWATATSLARPPADGRSPEGGR